MEGMAIAFKRHIHFITIYSLLIVVFLINMFVFPEKVLIHYTINIFILSGIFFSLIYALFFVNERKVLVLSMLGISAALLLAFIIFVYFLPEAGYPPLLDLFNDQINI